MTIDALSLRYPGSGSCLQDLCLSIRPGEMVTIHGRSGCGKSSLLSCINGIVPHLLPAEVSGSIGFQGQDISRLHPEERCHLVGSLFQDFESQLVHSRVDDELSFGPANLGVPLPELRARVEEVRFLIALDASMDPGTLSGGNMQRLCLGAALTMKPRLLVLDEPFSNVDVGGAHALLGFLRHFCDQGNSVLMAEHRLDLLGTFPDRSLLLEEGRLWESRGPQRQEPPMMGAPLGDGAVLVMRGVGFSYAGQENLLRSIDLTVQEGESIVISGENGCGKSTLLRLAAGILHPQQGDLNLMGSRKRHWRGWPRGSVGLIWQNPNHQLFMDTVASELLMNTQYEEDVNPLLKRFGLWEQRNSHPQRLSEGQKRRLAVATVLAGRPKLLLLDEPTLGQDDQSLCCMIKALEEQRRRTGMAIISVTHDLRASRPLGRRTYALREGTLHPDA